MRRRPRSQRRPRPLSAAVTFDGVSVFTPAEIRHWLHLDEGKPLPQPVEKLGEELEEKYHREGYTRAKVQATFDEATGALRLAADEGRIDEVALEGIEGKLLDVLQGNFDVRAGDIFNSRVIDRALDRLLEPARGAIISKGFDLIDRAGRRVLVVELDRRAADADVDFGPGQREDWYSPVDGFSPAAGFKLTLFDSTRFHHTFIRSYVTYKFARESAGFSVGFERPILGAWDGPRLYVGAEAHEITATDDAWRLSTLEQSVVALTFANTFRDYHISKGYQLHAAYPDELRRRKSSRAGATSSTSRWRTPPTTRCSAMAATPSGPISRRRRGI